MDKNRYELYLEMAKQTHQDPNTWRGTNLRDHHIDAIDDLIKQQGIKTILDYGCGKAHYHQKDSYFRSCILLDNEHPSL